MPLTASTSGAPTAPDAPAFPDDAVEVGRILGPWGIKGAFKVQAFAADPQALFSTKRWFLRAAEERPLRAARPVPPLLRIAEAREQAAWVVASAAEVPDREAAEALKGARVFIARSSFPTAGADEYYWVDLLGCEVSTREGVALGRVIDLIDTGTHSVLRVQEGDTPERLIPFVAAYVDEVDLSARCIRVDWGLDY